MSCSRPPAKTETTEKPIETSVLQSVKDAKVYFIFDGKRHHIPDPATLEALGLTKQVEGASDSQIDAVPLGDPLPSLSSKTIQKASTGEVFVLEAGKRRHVPDPETLAALHITGSQIQGVPDKVADAFPLGEPIPHQTSH